MVNDQIPRSTVIRRLLALTSEGKIKWEHDGEKPASSFGLRTESINGLLFRDRDGDRVGLQIREPGLRLDQLMGQSGGISPQLLLGPQPARVTVWSDDADEEVASLVRYLYEEVAARANVPDDPFAKLWSDLDAFES